MPHGRYANPSICDDDHIRAVARTLERSAVRLLTGPFDAVLASAAAGDFIYFDPPYAPVSITSVFTSYTAEGFDGDDQERLRDIVVQLVRRECRVLLSNSTAPEITRLVQQRRDAEARRRRAHGAREASDQFRSGGARERGRVPDHQYRAERLRADLIRIGVAGRCKLGQQFLFEWRSYDGRHHPPDPRDLCAGPRPGVGRRPGVCAERAGQGQGRRCEQSAGRRSQDLDHERRDERPEARDQDEQEGGVHPDRPAARQVHHHRRKGWPDLDSRRPGASRHG